MAPHTATGEWQSFEMRMRRRRAERLALRAEVAAKAGCLEDARACLAEARALVPGLTAVTEAERILSSVRELPPPGSYGVRPLQFAVGGTAAALLIGGAFFLATSRGGAVGPLASRPVAFSIEAPAAPVRSVLVLVAAAEPDPEVVAALGPSDEAAATTPGVPDLSRPAGGLGSPAVEEGASPAPVTAPPPAPVTAAVEAEPLPTEPVMSAPPAVSASPVVTAPTVVSPPPAVSAPPAAAEAPQEPLVRGVLNDYAAAYSRLDADAAKRVWPAVNRAALSRAFEGLASQDVSLGNCNVAVTGVKARAQCAGSTTWSPRIGSGEATEGRRWTFELARTGSDWRIVSVQVQNR